MKRFLSTAVITIATFALFGSRASLRGQCTTPSSYVYCSSCPSPLQNCYQSYNWSYSVFGYISQVWCTYPGDGVGFCSGYDNCTTVSSIATSQDCNGYNYATQGQLCCMDNQP